MTSVRQSYSHQVNWEYLSLEIILRGKTFFFKGKRGKQRGEIETSLLTLPPKDLPVALQSHVRVRERNLIRGSE